MVPAFSTDFPAGSPLRRRMEAPTFQREFHPLGIYVARKQSFRVNTTIRMREVFVAECFERLPLEENGWDVLHVRTAYLGNGTWEIARA